MITGTVDIWMISLCGQDEVEPGLEDMLDDAERARARALPSAARRRRFTVAHGAARLILGTQLGLPPGQIRWRHGPAGKPELDRTPELEGPPADLRFSLSDSGDLAALAVTRGRAVGVDLQRLPAVADPAGLAERFYPSAESRFVAEGGPAGQVSRLIRLWTRKEACVKATGGRLMPGLKLPVGGAGRVVVRAGDGPYLVQDVPAPSGYLAAVAVSGAAPCQVSRRAWP